MVPPISLTDDQLDSVMRAAALLHPDDRAPFLERVAERLRGCEIGDGVVGRAVREAQREFWQAPADVSATHLPKWSSRRRSVRASAEG